MKKFIQKPELVLSLEKDQKQNETGMQMRVWSVNNGTTIFVRLFKHNKEAIKKLWNGQRDSDMVDKFILEQLEINGLIKNANYWGYDPNGVSALQEQDEFEEKEKCLYFAWSVAPIRLHF